MKTLVYIILSPAIIAVFLVAGLMWAAMMYVVIAYEAIKGRNL